MRFTFPRIVCRFLCIEGELLGGCAEDIRAAVFAKIWVSLIVGNAFPVDFGRVALESTVCATFEERQNEDVRHHVLLAISLWRYHPVPTGRTRVPILPHTKSI